MTVANTPRKFFTCSTAVRTFFMFFMLCGLLLFVQFPTPDPQEAVYHCYMDNEQSDEESGNADNPLSVLKNVFNAKEKPLPGKTIFFFETKCNCSDPDYRIFNFTAHQACSVESAALHHPNFEVFVLFACPTMRHENHPITNALLSYKNVKLRYVNLRQFSKGTPIEDWLKSYSLFHTSFLMFTVSDLFRILALYNYGGIYLDMDVIVMRSFEKEPPNFMGAETEESIGNSVIGLEAKDFGHEVAGQLLTDFYRNYKGNVWAHNGPKSLVRVMTKICGTSDVQLMEEDPYRCRGIKLYGINAFYEINWGYRYFFFDPKRANETLSRLENSHATHTWNHLKTDWPFRTNSTSAYIQIAARNCPKVFKATGEYFT